MKTYRQGDVLIEEVTGIPTNVKPVPRENGLAILAHGEVTGHHHSFASGSVALLEAPSGERFLAVKRQATLRHQEHGPITVPKGRYRVKKQLEYTPAEIRRVAD